MVSENIQISKDDWDSFEISCDFKRHPLVCDSRIKDAFHGWENLCENRFNRIKDNEDELNRVFIEIYGLQTELLAEVRNEDIAVKKADKE